MKSHVICPMCGSPNVSTDFSNAGAVDFGFLNNKVCNNCGHSSTQFLLASEDSIPDVIPAKQVKEKGSWNNQFTSGLIWTYGFIAISAIILTLLYIIF